MPIDTTRMTLTGDRELRKLLEELPKRVVKKGLRQAITAAAQPIVRSARGRVTKESGLLKKSLTKKVKSYRSGNVAAIVGANRAVQGEFKGRKRVPANYIHLLEKGHGGPHPASPHEFLKPAYDAEKGNAVGIAAAKLKTVVEAEALKLAKLK